jgi:Crp-like helix-turn-helix domain
VVQRAGGAYRMNGQDLTHEFERSTPVMHLLLRYAQALMAQMAQRAVCNRHHSLDQQLCHWLLLRLDRLCESELAMTQEAIANNLGTRRESVTVAALKLQALGLIRYSRGHISVLDRRGLERRACECYAAVKQEYARLLPDTVVAQPAGPQHAGAPQREPTPALTANAGAAANANPKTTTAGTAHAGGFGIPAPRHEQRDEPALIAP